MSKYLRGGAVQGQGTGNIALYVDALLKHSAQCALDCCVAVRLHSTEQLWHTHISFIDVFQQLC